MIAECLQGAERMGINFEEELIYALSLIPLAPEYEKVLTQVRLGTALRIFGKQPRSCHIYRL